MMSVSIKWVSGSLACYRCSVDCQLLSKTFSTQCVSYSLDFLVSTFVVEQLVGHRRGQDEVQPLVAYAVVPRRYDGAFRNVNVLCTHELSSAL